MDQPYIFVFAAVGATFLFATLAAHVPVPEKA
jgi:hypothetical protein